MKWKTRYLQLAKQVATWSKDPSRKIGCVAIGSKGQVLSQGFNGFARGVHDHTERLNDRQEKYKFIIHAEMNAIFNATLNGVSLCDSDMYVYGLPVCNECAKGIIQVGVKRVFISTDGETVPDNWLESWEFSQRMMQEAGVEIELLTEKLKEI